MKYSFQPGFSLLVKTFYNNNSRRKIIFVIMILYMFLKPVSKFFSLIKSIIYTSMQSKRLNGN